MVQRRRGCGHGDGSGELAEVGEHGGLDDGLHGDSFRLMTPRKPSLAHAGIAAFADDQMIQ